MHYILWKKQIHNFVIYVSENKERQSEVTCIKSCNCLWIIFFFFYFKYNSWLLLVRRADHIYQSSKKSKAKIHSTLILKVSWNLRFYGKHTYSVFFKSKNVYIFKNIISNKFSLQEKRWLIIYSVSNSKKKLTVFFEIYVGF